MKHDKQCGSGSPLFNWLCIGACSAPAVMLILFYPDSPWFSAALMLAICGGGHFLLMRSTAAHERDAAQRPEVDMQAPKTDARALDSEANAPKGVVPMPEGRTRDTA